MTYIAALHPDRPSIDSDEARFAYFDYTFPYWEVAVNPDRFVTEGDLPMYDAAADESRVSNEDWEAMAEAMWTEHRDNM